MLHEENHHCGPQALLAASRAQFWITNGKSVARSIVHKYVRCTKARPMLFKQLMGNPPASRVTPARTFIKTGVDYFGPIWIHHKIRGKRPDKAYVAVFCCFATKAIHMEVVSNLSTEAFIGALRRFIGRRGHCQTLYSDNATNFVGASNQLAELKESIYSQSAQEKISRVCSDKAINFKFIPPRAPHFGGLWEAAVKSAKHHLIRSVSAASLTYEELETVIVEIEAILNSRPLIPLSSSYDDLDALTPGHFLVGEPLNSTVDVNAKSPKMSLGGRWKLTSEIKHKFWKEWTQNYLQELQQRGKWKSPSPNVNEGMLVIIKEDNTPVLQWPLGRITRIYKGDDGLIRVCDVKTARATLKRPIHRLAPLLNDTQSEYSEYSEPASLKRQHPPKDDNSTSQRKRKIVSYSSQGLFSTVLLSLLLLPLILASPINITEFPSNPGLYFEGIGSTKLVTATWRFIIYYDLTPLWERNKVLEDGITSLSSLCNRSVASESCDAISQQLRHTWDGLIQETDLLAMKRRRRGALDVIGNVAHALFGVLDSDYADHMSQIIADVKENENFVQVLVKNQTSVIDSTINVLKESETNTRASLSQLTQTIYNDLNAIEDENSKLRQGQHIMSLAIQLNKLASDLQRIETDLIAALTYTNHGNLSPLILTPRQLRSEITRIKGHLPTGRTLPVDDNDLVELYKVMEIKGAVTNGKIIFIAEIPLVNHERFELYKVIPIPTQAGNTTIVIQTTIEYLAVNDHRDEYVVLNTFHFNKCVTIMIDVYLCPSLQVRFARESDSYSCEVARFNNKTSPNCNFSHVQGNISIIAMNTNNQWVYATTKPMEMTAVCGNDIINIHINASGTLAIEPRCVLKGRFLTIHGHETSVTALHTSYASFGNLTTIGNPTNIKKLLQPSIDFDTQLEHITSIQKRLQDIKYLPTEERHSPLHQPYISIVALLVSLCIILCLLIERIKNKCNKFDISQTPMPTPPQPMPRIHISEV